MIQQYSYLKVTDNTGAKEIRCIRVLGSKKQDQAVIGDIIVASVKKALPHQAVKKKEVVKAIIVRQRAPLSRADGTVIKFDDNAAVLINADGSPRGTRVIGPIAREIRDKGYSKIVSMAPELV